MLYGKASFVSDGDVLLACLAADVTAFGFALRYFMSTVSVVRCALIYRRWSRR